MTSHLSIILYVLIVILGMMVVLIPESSKRADSLGLWSDFKAFEKNVLAHPSGKEILSFGGENPDDDFSDLLDSLLELSPSNPAAPFGFAISIVGTLGLTNEVVRNRAKKGSDSAIEPPETH